jgi:hypothetical protein
VRSYIRHPSDIPIQVDIASGEKISAQSNGTSQLNNVSYGGLAFNSAEPAAVGSVIKLKIDHVQPVFQAEGVVSHCQKEGDHFVIGIEFLSKEKLFVVRMVEQICHIEHYKKEVAINEGRILSGEQAAREWIDRFAESFPQWANK